MKELLHIDIDALCRNKIFLIVCLLLTFWQIRHYGLLRSSNGSVLHSALR